MPEPLDGLPRVDVGDPAGAAEALRLRADALAGVAAELDELVGTAASDDGYVRVTVGRDGLERIDLEPRAMRMPSQDLAEAIVVLTRRATQDLVARRRELTAAAGVDAGPPDLGDARAKLAELEQLTRSGNGDMVAVYERFRHRLG